MKERKKNKEGNHAEKLTSGNWRCRATRQINGKRISKSFTAATAAEAELMARIWLVRGEKDEEFPTLDRAIDRFLENRSKVLSPSTLRSYEYMAEAYKEKLGRVVINDITSEMLQGYVNELAKTKSPKTVKNYSAFIGAVLASVVPDKRFNITLPKSTPTQYAVPCDNELKQLLDNSTGDLHLAILLGAVGGLRRGEICALKQADILRDLRAIYIHADMVRTSSGLYVYKPTPKTAASVRRVELPKEIIDQIPEGDPDEYIFHITPAALTDRFCRLRDKLGLECRFHDLRHYCVSYLHSIGVPDQYIQERGGWSTDHTLKSVYRNTLKDKSIKFAKMANDSFTDMLGESIAN